MRSRSDVKMTDDGTGRTMQISAGTAEPRRTTERGHVHEIAPEDVGEFRTAMSIGALAGLGTTIAMTRSIGLPTGAAVMLGLGVTSGMAMLGGIIGAALLDRT